MRPRRMHGMGKQATACLLAGQAVWDGWDDQVFKGGPTSGPWGHRLCGGCRSAKKKAGHRLPFSVPELMGIVLLTLPRTSLWGTIKKEGSPGDKSFKRTSRTWSALPLLGNSYFTTFLRHFLGIRNVIFCSQLYRINENLQLPRTPGSPRSNRPN